MGGSLSPTILPSLSWRGDLEADVCEDRSLGSLKLGLESLLLSSPPLCPILCPLSWFAGGLLVEGSWVTAYKGSPLRGGALLFRGEGCGDFLLLVGDATPVLGGFVKHFICAFFAVVEVALAPEEVAAPAPSPG